MLRLFEKMGFDVETKSSEGVYELKMAFAEVPRREKQRL